MIFLLSFFVFTQYDTECVLCSVAQIRDDASYIRILCVHSHSFMLVISFLHIEACWLVNCLTGWLNGALSGEMHLLTDCLTD